MADEQILYRNSQWVVIPDFLECQDNGYWIDWGRLDNRHDDGDYEWHHHMSGKNWVDFDLFCDGFRQAAKFASLTIDVDKLERTERVCREYLEDREQWERQPRRKVSNSNVYTLADITADALDFHEWRRRRREGQL